MQKKRSKGLVSILATVVLFVVVLIVLTVGTSSLSGSADAQGLAATKNAIERATVLCYATEGFYPPGLSYLEKNYGIQVDHTRYAVRYEVYATNIMPTITVSSW